jgi:hypothetical protein
LHVDVDVFQAAEMPAAYFPHADGAELLRALVADPRVRVVEVTEYATLRDGDRRWVGTLVDLLARRRARPAYIRQSDLELRPRGGQ